MLAEIRKLDDAPSLPHPLAPIYRSFLGVKSLTKIQTESFPTLFGSDSNAVISAPTGSGKTLLMELAMTRLFTTDRSCSKKVLYISPSKALCQEKHSDWSKRLQRVYKKACLVTGDSDVNEINEELADFDVFVATPEKWESLTRNWEDARDFFNSFYLILIDEAHILNEKRGVSLEVIIGRMKLLRGDGNCRIVMASATIPNPEDLAQWIGHGSDTPAKVLAFGEADRAIPLMKHVYSSSINSRNPFTYDLSLNSMLPGIIETHSNGQQTLVFCNTRKSAEATAEYLANCNQKATKKMNMQDLIASGVAYHHAGLEYSEKLKIERMFKEGTIKVLCATSTLASGVNLPAHLVIIKNTLQYGQNGYQEYNEMDILQMMGRAGRPQYDTFGVAVIITDDSRKAIYENLAQGTQKITSRLNDTLMEYINSEISLGIIVNMETALKWLRSTFLYVTMNKERQQYGIEDKVSVDSYFSNIVHQTVQSLIANELIVIDENGRFVSTSYGRTMSRCSLKLETVSKLKQLPFASSVSRILQTLSKAEEFRDIKFSPGDKGIINEALKENRVRFKDTSDKIKDIWEKIYYSIQILLEGSGSLGKYNDTFLQEARSLSQQMSKLCLGLIDVLRPKQDGISLRNAIELLSCINGKAWHDSVQKLQFLDGIGAANCATLLKAGISTFFDFSETQPSRIETLLNRRPPFGNQLVHTLRSKIPLFALDSCQVDEGTIRLTYGLEEASSSSLLPMVKRQLAYLLVILRNEHGWIIQKFEKIRLHKLASATSHSIDVNCHGCEELTASLMYSQIPGINLHLVITPNLQFERAFSPPGQNDEPAPSTPQLKRFSSPVNLVKEPVRTLKRPVEEDFDIPDLDLEIYKIEQEIHQDFHHPAKISPAPARTEKISYPKLKQAYANVDFRSLERINLASYNQTKIPKLPSLKDRKTIQKTLKQYQFKPIQAHAEPTRVTQLIPFFQNAHRLKGNSDKKPQERQDLSTDILGILRGQMRNMK